MSEQKIIILRKIIPVDGKWNQQTGTSLRRDKRPRCTYVELYPLGTVLKPKQEGEELGRKRG